MVETGSERKFSPVGSRKERRTTKEQAAARTSQVAVWSSTETLLDLCKAVEAAFIQLLAQCHLSLSSEISRNTTHTLEYSETLANDSEHRREYSQVWLVAELPRSSQLSFPARY